MASIAAFAAPALAADSDGAQGGRILRSIEGGQRNCGDLKTADFEQVGEYVMGRMIGSVPAHQSMNETMRTMVGPSGERSMHVALGQRFTDCGQGRLPAGLATMMNGFGGMMSIGGMMGGGGSGPGMIGPGGSGIGPQNGGDHYGNPGSTAGSMMGLNRAGGDGDDESSAWMAILMLVLIVGAGAAALVIGRRRRPKSVPLDLLAQRFSRGEMTAEDYGERRALLEGGRR